LLYPFTIFYILVYFIDHIYQYIFAAEIEITGVVHFKKKLLLIIYSLPCHLRCPRLSFSSQKEIKVFDGNIPGFSPYNGLHWEPNGSRSK